MQTNYIDIKFIRQLVLILINIHYKKKLRTFFLINMFYSCLVHTLSSRHLPMLKGVYNSYIEVRNKNFHIFFSLLCEEIQWPFFFIQKSNFFFGIFNFRLRYTIYIHILRWVGFSLVGYIPKTLYNYKYCFVSNHSRKSVSLFKLRV
jgi:hypothetical protein